MIWNPHYECMDREEMRALQLKRLKETLARVYEGVPFYRERLDACGIKPTNWKNWRTSAGCLLQRKMISGIITRTACSQCR